VIVQIQAPGGDWQDYARTTAAEAKAGLRNPRDPQGQPFPVGTKLRAVADYGHGETVATHEVLAPKVRRTRTTSRHRAAQDAAQNAQPVVDTTDGGSPPSTADSRPPTAGPAVEPETANALAQRILDVRRQGVSRRVLAELASLSQPQLWRCEQGRVRPEEVEPLTAALVKAATGDLPEHLRPKRATTGGPKVKPVSKAELTHRIEVVVELLRTARTDKGITKAALVDAALAVIDPSPPESTD